MQELVILDCDGVLVGSEAISNEVVARMLTRDGLPTTLSEARRDFQGLLLTDILTRAEAKLRRPLPSGWLGEYEHLRAEAFQRDLKPVAGAAEAVQRVTAAGLMVCVASQGALGKTRMTLGLTGLRDLFSPHGLFSAPTGLACPREAPSGRGRSRCAARSVPGPAPSSIYWHTPAAGMRRKDARKWPTRKT